MTVSTDVVLGIDIGTTSSKAVARSTSRQWHPLRGAAHPVAHR